MHDFPEFMKNPANRIAKTDQATPGVEGYVFDGVDGSQMAFWTCRESAPSAAHAHDCDEYMMVVEGCYTLIVSGERIPLQAGEEYFIPRGVVHSGEVVAGTRLWSGGGSWRSAFRLGLENLCSSPLGLPNMGNRSGSPGGFSLARWQR